MNQSEIVIRSRRDEFACVVEAVSRFASEHHLSGDVTKDLQISLDEILTNIVDYGYIDGDEHEILVCLRLADNVVEVVIEDDGVQFDPLTIAAPDVGAPLRERRAGGLGMHFVRSLTSDVVYERIGNRNRLVFRIMLES